jgi:hypothetical protein
MAENPTPGLKKNVPRSRSSCPPHLQRCGDMRCDIPSLPAERRGINLTGKIYDINNWMRKNILMTGFRFILFIWTPYVKVNPGWSIWGHWIPVRRFHPRGPFISHAAAKKPSLSTTIVNVPFRYGMRVHPVSAHRPLSRAERTHAGLSGLFPIPGSGRRPSKGLGSCGSL